MILFFAEQIDWKCLVVSVLESLSIHHIVPEGSLWTIYTHLRRFPHFKTAVNSAIKSGIEEGMRCLKGIMKQLVKEIRENKKVITLITKICAKSVARDIILKRAVAYGIKAGSYGTNVAGLVVDGTQAVLEQAGYEAAGEKVGLFGNVAIGCCAGSMCGVAGIPIGGLIGLGMYVAGQSVSKGLNKVLPESE